MANLNSPNNLGFALRDYHHAAKTFTQEPGYTKTPYTGFNFHVNISFNSLLGRLRNIETKDISVLVRAADLPETQFETETLNQYNRKRIINKRVVYQPIKIEFHDDIANNVRNMWIAYNQHYNADSKYTLNSSWNIDDVYANYSLNRRYGLDSGSSIPFINKIEIFSMGNNEYSKILLVNPVITNAQFDDHDYSESAKVMSLALTIEYENIIYSAGTTDQIPNFGRNNLENYDQNNSLLNAIDLSRNFVDSGSTNNRSSRPDTPVESVSLTSDQLSARQTDTVSGNVSRNNSNTNFNINNNQYNRIKQSIVTSSQSRASTYSFPDARPVSDANQDRQADSLRAFSNRLITDNSIINGNNNVSSNGGNISSSFVVNNNNTNISTEISNSAVTTAAYVNIAEIVINPIIPSNLTPAERQLFVRSYPPLPSTDQRATQPPYV
jgi:hypothetical protein